MNHFKSENVSCQPILNVKSLLAFDSANSKKYASTELVLPAASPDKPQFLVCHDMRNNYLDDKYFQGSNESNAFEFFHWQFIDMFVYFSHHLVSIPPESWINAAHENRCRCLGTFITEWNDGLLICNEILQSDETASLIVKKLVELTLFYDFDGWLINIENPIDNVSRLVSLVSELTESLRKIDSHRYKIIWYDSVIQNGQLKWQNELNSQNECFFSVSDAIFINYAWKEENLMKSKQTSGSRLNDVFIGVDVFGRGCFGGGGFNTNVAVAKLSKFNFNCALFAPGWLHECNKVEDFILNSQMFWQSFKSNVYKRRIDKLPIVSTFTHSRASKFFLNGEQLSLEPGWSNLSIQSLMPVLCENSEWCFEDAFYASSCVLISSDSIVNLFELDLNQNLNYLNVDYIFKKEKEENENNSPFYLKLDYNDSLEFDLKALNHNENIKVVDCFESLNHNSWNKVRFKIEFLNENIHLKGLNAFSPTKPTKLGFLRVYHSNKHNESLVKIENVRINSQKSFQLDGYTYLCAHIEWTRNKEKYVNVFIDIKLNSELKTQFKYIGSTRSNDFKICLKLNKKIKYNKSNKSNESDYSFGIHLQPIDELFTSLIDFKEEDIQTVRVKMNGLEGIEESVLDNYINQIVYDFELF